MRWPVPGRRCWLLRWRSSSWWRTGRTCTHTELDTDGGLAGGRWPQQLVIDLNQHWAVDGYQIPPRMREHLHLTYPHIVHGRDR